MVRTVTGRASGETVSKRGSLAIVITAPKAKVRLTCQSRETLRQKDRGEDDCIHLWSLSFSAVPNVINHDEHLRELYSSVPQIQPFLFLLHINFVV